MSTRRLVIGMAVLALLAGDLAVSPTRQAHAASWRMFGATPDRTGRAFEEASPPLTQAWTAALGGPILASPLVAGDRIIVSTDGGDLVALSESGAVIWRTALGARVRATPVIADGKIRVPARNGSLYTLSLENGEILSQTAVGGDDGASPVIAGEVVIGGGGYPDTSIYAVTLASGGVRWKFETGSFVYASPAVGPDGIFAASGSGRLYRLGLDGSLKWASAPSGGNYFVTPLVANGSVYLAGGGADRTVVSRDLATGGAKWTYAMPGDGPSHPSAIATDGSRIYLVGGVRTASYVLEQRLYALDAMTGASRWSVGGVDGVAVGAPTGLGYSAAPVVAQDVVYAAGGTSLYAFTPSSGGALGQWTLDGGVAASPAVANGRVYVGTMKGTLYAFDAALAVALRSPDHGDLVRGPVQVSALIRGHAPQSVSVETAPGRTQPDDGGFTPLFNAAVSSGESVAVGTWATARLAPGDHTVRLTVTDSNGRVARALAYVRGSPELGKKRITAADGGTVTASDGTFVRIEPGGLAGDTEITINQGNQAQDGATIGTTEREILLNPVVALTKRATLSIPYAAADAAGKRPGYFRVFWFDPAAGAWTPVNTSVPKPSDAPPRVEAQVSHFSLFRVQEFAPGGALLSPDGVYAYPNPARSVGKVTFKFLLNDAADVTVKVFNVAGEQVAELAGSYDASAAGLTRSLDWDLGGTASGVYYYRVEAKNALRTDAVTKKLAVIQ